MVKTTVFLRSEVWAKLYGQGIALCCLLLWKKLWVDCSMHFWMFDVCTCIEKLSLKLCLRIVARSSEYSVCSVSSTKFFLDAPWSRLTPKACLCWLVWHCAFDRVQGLQLDERFPPGYFTCSDLGISLLVFTDGVCNTVRSSLKWEAISCSPLP